MSWVLNSGRSLATTRSAPAELALEQPCLDMDKLRVVIQSKEEVLEVLLEDYLEDFNHRV
jgi:hypothetical protein